MQGQSEAQNISVKTSRDFLVEILGENDPYPTPDEIAAHKERGSKLNRQNAAILFDNCRKVDFKTFCKTLEESKITSSYEIGCFLIHEGNRGGNPVLLMESLTIKRYGIGKNAHIFN